MTEKENDPMKHVEELLKKMEDLLKIAEENITGNKAEEKSECSLRCQKSAYLASKIKFEIIDLMEDDREVSFMALCKVAASFGVFSDFSKEKQTSGFEAAYKTELANYNFLKPKLDAIKEILKGS